GPTVWPTSMASPPPVGVPLGSAAYGTRRRGRSQAARTGRNGDTDETDHHGSDRRQSTKAQTAFRLCPVVFCLIRLHPSHPYHPCAYSGARSTFASRST